MGFDESDFDKIVNNNFKLTNRKNNLANGRIICYDYKLKTCSVPKGHGHIEQRESF